MGVVLLAVAAVAAGAKMNSSVAPPFVNPGTPNGVPQSFDCAARQHAWEFGKATLPRRGSFRTLYDALQLQACAVPTPEEVDVWKPPKLPNPAAPKPAPIFVSPAAPAGGTGSIQHPFGTIQEAVNAAAGTAGSTILLRGGVHHTGQVVITPAHVNLTIQNYDGEEAVISGGVPIKAQGKWQKHKVTPREFATTQNANNIYAKAAHGSDSTWVKFVGTFDTWADCALAAAESPKGPFGSITWHDPDFVNPSNPGQVWAKQCYGVVNNAWAPLQQMNVTSGRFVGQNTWKLDVSGQGIDDVLGLRFKNERAVRAKYPNGHPELSGEYYYSTNPRMGVGQYVDGWVTVPTTWVGPEDQAAKWADAKDIVINNTDWPSVNWKPYQEGGSSWTGEGDWGDYHLGMDGFCKDVNPPFGYWCSKKSPRGNCYDPDKGTSCGWPSTHMSPSGFLYEKVLPQASGYKNPEGAIVQVWRGKQRWYTNQCVVDKVDTASGTIHFSQELGCNQGGEGDVDGSQWWIENVLEECDSPGEYYFSKDEQMLYYSFNESYLPQGDEEFVATKTKVIFNVTGSQAKPVVGFALRGVTIRDTAYTYVGTDPADIHGLPSGGDWALQRSGAVLLEGTDSAVIADSLLTRVDGNGIFLSNYNNKASIVNNEFSWIGDSAMAAWGSTGTCLNEQCTKTVPYGVGPDGRGGNHPKDTYIGGNLVREIGIWQKQSSMWFQAITVGTHLEGNVHFNGPRAGINLNDGFGGGDVIEGNLLANCVRESGDHGPVNTWDRVPYITDYGLMRNVTVANITGPTPGHVKSPIASVIPMYRNIQNNFVFDVYNSQVGIDNDDGSSYYLTHDNYFVYASSGLKSDFGGQWNHHFRNVYAYVDQCFQFGNNLAFYNNTCQVMQPNGYASTCNGKMPPSMTVKANYARSNTTIHICPGDDGSVSLPFLGDAELSAAGARVLAPYPKPVPGQ